MRLPFLDRREELDRLRARLEQGTGTFSVLHGRRRCGKSRLLAEALAGRRAVHHVGDDREAALQREGLAAEVARILPGFDQVRYPDWDALLTRFWREAAAGTVLALDELPALVAAAPEIPSLLQKRLDADRARGIHLLVAGSSQRMMQGLVLDGTAPLFGRADEILRVGPLPAGWLQRALRLRDAVEAVEAWAAWGGVPRYWELATDYPDLETALQRLVLSPAGVLHEEPSRLLLDDMRDTTQAASILSLIGRGCHRLFEVAARLEAPASSLTRPLSRLVEIGLVRRETPFGASERATKRTSYVIADPFLRLWFRFVEPERSRLQAGRVEAVMNEVRRRLPHLHASAWEELARASVTRREWLGRGWGAARRWWGGGRDRKPLEIDLVAESDDGAHLLVGEVKWSSGLDARSLLDELARKADNAPFVGGRQVHLALWLKTRPGRPRGGTVFCPIDVMRALR